MSDKRVKLNQTQEELYKKLLESYTHLFGQINAMIENNMTMRLERMAIESGIDLANEKWSFNHKTLEFVMEDEEPKEATFQEETTPVSTGEQEHKDCTVQVECLGFEGSTAE